MDKVKDKVGFSRQGRGRGQNFMQRDRRQELHCTYCKKSRHMIADCFTLKLDLKVKGYND